VEPDVLLFWGIVAMLFVVGLPLIRRSVTVPAEMETDVVDLKALPGPVRDHFAALDRELAALGYQPGLVFRIPNLGHDNAIRLYLHGSGDSFCLGNTVSSTSQAGREGRMFQEFIDEFTDGSSVTTRNSELDEVLIRLPKWRVVTLPGASVSDLYQEHRRLVGETGRIPRRWDGPEAILARGRESHREVMACQVEQGLLEPEAGTGRLRATWRLGVRGILQYLNPLAGNFTIGRFLAVMGTSLAIHLCGLPLLALLAEQVARRDPHMALVVEPMGKTFLFFLVGWVVGARFTGKTFLWGFLAIYLPRALTGSGMPGQFLWGLWAGFVADQESGRRLRAGDLLRPSSPP